MTCPVRINSHNQNFPLNIHLSLNQMSIQFTIDLDRAFGDQCVGGGVEGDADCTVGGKRVMGRLSVTLYFQEYEGKRGDRYSLVVEGREGVYSRAVTIRMSGSWIEHVHGGVV